MNRMLPYIKNLFRKGKDSPQPPEQSFAPDGEPEEAYPVRYTRHAASKHKGRCKGAFGGCTKQERERKEREPYLSFKNQVGGQQ